MFDGLLRRLMERFLIPWYDRDKAEAVRLAAVKREEHTEAIRVRSIAARMKAEQVREAYKLSAERTKR